MTPGEWIYAVILFVLVGAISFFLCPTKYDAKTIPGFLLLSFFIRVLLVYLNGALDFFDQKGASEVPLHLILRPHGIADVFSNGLTAFFQTKFVVQALLNIPGVKLFDASITTLCLTNAWLGTMCGAIVYAYLRRLYDRRTAVYGLLLASVYPGAVAFSIFALRDLLVYTLITANILSLMWIMNRRDARALNIAIYLVSLAAATSVRYVFLPVLIAPTGWLVLTASIRRVEKTKRRSRMLGYYVAAITIPIMVYAAGSTALHLAAAKLNLAASDTGLMALAGDYATARYDRTVSDGQVMAGSGGSNILPPGVYSRLPIPIRVAVQTIGIIIVPMPWLLTGAARLLAGFDSVFICFCIAWALRARRLNRINPALLVTFALGTLTLGLVVANSGNAFRMRLSTSSYIIIPAAIYLGTRQPRRLKSYLRAAAVGGA